MSLTSIEAQATTDINKLKVEYVALLAKSYAGKTVAILVAVAFVAGLIVRSIL